MRGIEIITRLALSGVDPAVEAGATLEAEMEDVVSIDGAAMLLAALPADRLAIVTSSPRERALRRFAAAGLPVTAVLVAAEDVERGKPVPDCFVLAAERLGQRIEDCLVFKDAPAGIAAAEATGAAVAVVTITQACDGHGASDDRGVCEADGRIGTTLRRLLDDTPPVDRNRHCQRQFPQPGEEKIADPVMGTGKALKQVF